MGSFGKDFVVEAENHREAARQFFAQCIVVATTTSMALSFGSALFVALAFLVQLASAELLAILPDIADSTKQSAQLLRELRDQSKREV